MYRRKHPAESYQHLELLKLSKSTIENGTGRPTKKDRRDIDEFGNEIKNTKRRRFKLLLFKN
jgi:ribosome-associated heat shock protein Hsp15